MITVDEFMFALENVRLTEHELKALRAQYDSPDHTLSAKEMAQHLGYTHYGRANLTYGVIGKRVAAVLSKPLPRSSDGGTPHGFLVLSEDYKLSVHYRPDSEYQWIMRPELAEALRRCGLV